MRQNETTTILPPRSGWNASTHPNGSSSTPTKHQTFLPETPSTGSRHRPGEGLRPGGGVGGAGTAGVGVGVGGTGDNKEIMHVLESTLITWTKQIKNVLKQVRC